MYLEANPSVNLTHPCMLHLFFWKHSMFSNIRGCSYANERSITFTTWLVCIQYMVIIKIPLSNKCNRLVATHVAMTQIKIYQITLTIKVLYIKLISYNRNIFYNFSDIEQNNFLFYIFFKNSSVFASMYEASHLDQVYTKI